VNEQGYLKEETLGGKTSGEKTSVGPKIFIRKALIRKMVIFLEGNIWQAHSFFKECPHTHVIMSQNLINRPT
jgi:hypothetical protein